MNNPSSEDVGSGRSRDSTPDADRSVAPGDVEVSPEEQLIIEMLSSGETHAATGAAINRSAKYIQRKVKDPGFAALVRERSAERLQEAVGRLGVHVLDAVDTMHSELQAERPADRLRAASLIVASLVRVREQAQLDGVLAELRDQIADLRAQIAEAS